MCNDPLSEQRRSYTLPPQSIQSFDELSLVFTKEYSFYCSIKKKLNHLFNVKKNSNESFHNYVKRFKVEKAKIVRCYDSIASVAFQKGLSTDHLLFRELIMKEDLTLVDLFALAEKYALWDEAWRVDKAPELPRKKSAIAQKKEDGKQYNNKSRDRSRTKGGPTPKNYSKFLIPIHQVLHDIKREPWLKLPKQSKGDTSKLDHTKYCAFYRGLSHTTDDCYTWRKYLEKLVKEGKVDIYLDKPAAA
ncbi:unnamed protein product [Malus baccata var. baccata]